MCVKICEESEIASRLGKQDVTYLLFKSAPPDFLSSCGLLLPVLRVCYLLFSLNFSSAFAALFSLYSFLKKGFDLHSCRPNLNLLMLWLTSVRCIDYGAATVSTTFKR